MFVWNDTFEWDMLITIYREKKLNILVTTFDILSLKSEFGKPLQIEI